jgi:negative regulator of sigma E activity
MAIAVLALATLAPAHADEDAPVDDARRAAEELSYSGRVMVRWVDATGSHHADLEVRAGAGVLVLDGPAVLMARGGERLLRGAEGAWDVLWSSTLRPDPPPAAGDKYEVVESAGPEVAGRPTTVVSVSHRGTLRELLYLDESTGLVLRREQLDRRGRLRRAVSFESVAVDQSAGVPNAPRRLRHRSPRAAVADELGRPYRAPARLVGGYQRIGTYRRDGTVQIHYSDGLYGLSVFEQAGRVDFDGLPPGGRLVAVGETPGWRWSWPGGDILLWAGGGAVYTAVSDGPFEEVVAAAASITATSGGGEPSAAGKLRRACRALLRAFA